MQIEIRRGYGSKNPMFPNGFDPSTLDPKTIAELTQLMRSLPPEHLMRLQTIMHNTMAGHNTQAEIQSLESSLPSGFREQLMQILMRAQSPGTRVAQPATESALPGNEREARMTVLRAVAEGTVEPEDAYEVLF